MGIEDSGDKGMYSTLGRCCGFIKDNNALRRRRLAEEKTQVAAVRETRGGGSSSSSSSSSGWRSSFLTHWPFVNVAFRQEVPFFAGLRQRVSGIG
jgi:hypothetical protein